MLWWTASSSATNMRKPSRPPSQRRSWSAMVCFRCKSSRAYLKRKPNVSAHIARAAHGSVGAALTLANRLAHAGHPALAEAIHNAASSAFFSGFHTANYVAAGVAAAGAVMALALLPAQPTVRADDVPETPPLCSPATAAAGS